jgi:hypothetical protein
MDLKVNVDLMGNGQSKGQVANQLMTNGQLNLGKMRPFLTEDKFGNIKAYVTVYTGKSANDYKNPKCYKTYPINTNATLRRDEWKQLDESILEASMQRLGGVDDLISRGLVYNLGNAMGTTVLEWHTVAGSMEAVVTMDGITRGRNDRPEYNYNYLPIPIIHVDYELNARELAASRSLGNPLDTTDAQFATREILETLEEMLFTNTTFGFGETDSRGRNKIYSYVNHPDRNIVKLSVPWDHSACTAAGIIQDVQDMKSAATAAYHYGPFMLYIPTNFERVLDDDYTTSVNGTTLTIGERVLKLKNIMGIKVVDKLPADNVLLVQMTSDVIRMVRGMGITNVEWNQEGGMITKYKVMTIQVPQIRSDQNGKSGIVHMA